MAKINVTDIRIDARVILLEKMIKFLCKQLVIDYKTILKLRQRNEQLLTRLRK